MNIKNNIVFLPGWGFKASIWQGIGKELCGHNIIYCDLPQLTKKHNRWDFIGDYLAKQIPQNSIIIAWSLGGLAALYLCCLYPQICKKLILVASAPKFTAITESFVTSAEKNITLTMEKFLRFVQYPNHSALIRSELKNHLVNVKQEEQSLLYYLKLMQATDLSNIAAALPQPIVQMHGEKDAVVANNGNIKLIKNAGHALFLTHPKLCVNILQKCIA